VGINLSGLAALVPPPSLYIGKVNPVFLWLTTIRKKYKKKDAKRNDYLPSSSIITKLANGLKRWQSLKDPTHAKDYGIKPHSYLFRFLLRSFSPYGWFPFKA
jgi:hypothetical protein